MEQQIEEHLTKIAGLEKQLQQQSPLVHVTSNQQQQQAPTSIALSGNFTINNTPTTTHQALRQSLTEKSASLTSNPAVYLPSMGDIQKMDPPNYSNEKA